MTAIVALEEIMDLDELVVVDVATYQKMVAKMLLWLVSMDVKK